MTVAEHGGGDQLEARPDPSEPGREVLVIEDPEELVVTATTRLVDELTSVLAERPRASVALSGGSTPWRVFARLAEAPLPWERVDVFQVDERVAPVGDPARNLTHLRARLLDRVPAAAHPMPVDRVDSDDLDGLDGLQAAADEYAHTLPEVFDLVHLGLGDDGHTASLVPGDPALDETIRSVAVTGPYRGHRRMTLTFPVLDRARCAVWIVTGDAKRDALTRLLAGDPSIPAGRVRTPRQLLLSGVRHAAG